MIEMLHVHYTPKKGGDSESVTLCRACLDDQLGNDGKDYGEICDWYPEETAYDMPEDIVCDMCDIAMDDDEESEDE